MLLVSLALALGRRQRARPIAGVGKASTTQEAVRLLLLLFQRRSSVGGLPVRCKAGLVDLIASALRVDKPLHFLSLESLRNPHLNPAKRGEERHARTVSSPLVLRESQSRQRSFGNITHTIETLACAGSLLEHEDTQENTHA